MVDPSRLIRPRDQFREGFPKLNFREIYAFHTHREPVLVTDPSYLADVYNSSEEPARTLRDRGVFIMDFGGDTSCPVWWKAPFVLMPMSLHRDIKTLRPPPAAVVLADDVGTDSGSFVFLPLADDLPSTLKDAADEVLHAHNGAALALPAGPWSVWYEQWEAPEGREGFPPTFYRDVVIRWDA